jgi:hypothetical protein
MNELQGLEGLFRLHAATHRTHIHEVEHAFHGEAVVNYAASQRSKRERCGVGTRHGMSQLLAHVCDSEEEEHCS